MKSSRLMSGMMVGLSTFLLSAQPGGPPQVSLGVEINPSPAAVKATPEQVTNKDTEEKPDINEVIKTSTIFTNSVGMVLKKAGGLWIGAYETTQKEYLEVTSSNPSAFRGETRPVDSVSWTEAVAFCAKLTAHEKAEEMLPDGYNYALPTQAQWEAQANNIPLVNAVTSSSSRRAGTATVGSLPPNDSGLYDLRGNVSEWCADPADGPYRVLRGGSWTDWIEINLRPAFRIQVGPDNVQNTYGLRCVLIQGS